MRKDVRIMTFILAALLLLAVTAAVCAVRAHRYRTELENGYTRAVNGLTESVTALDIQLHKCLCTGTPESFLSSAAVLLSSTQKAKLQTAALPVQDGRWDSIERFISYCGDYIISAAQNGMPDEEQRSVIVKLGESAGELRLLLEEFIAAENSTDGWDEEWERLALRTGNINLPETGCTLVKVGDEFCFQKIVGDAASGRKPALLSGSDEVTQAQAQQKAQDITGTSGVFCMGASDGTTDEYIFLTTDRKTELAVTRSGGEIRYMMRSVRIGRSRITVSEAQKSAEMFMKKAGLGEMSLSGCAVYGGMCVFSFAPVQDGIVLYPDKVKVSVALDCGDVVAYDASEYIMKHHQRRLAAMKTRTEAEKCVSDMLTVTDSRLAVISSADMQEKLCYEFICDRWDGGEAVVYINASTLAEEKILLLSRTAFGISAA